MATATLAAAEKLQIALGQTYYADDFASFVPPIIMQQITLDMKAMKKLLKGHPEFKSGSTLKKINELSLEEFLKVMRLIFGTEAADLSSAEQQILRAFQGKSLSFERKPYLCQHYRSRRHTRYRLLRKGASLTSW